MAYGDYGAFVYLNGNRMKEYEDCTFNKNLVHGLIQDGDISVACYKQGLPTIYYKDEKVDYYNDEDMLDIAGVSYVVDNAPDDLKEKADHVTLSNNDDGVAFILNQFYDKESL